MYLVIEGQGVRIKLAGQIEMRRRAADHHLLRRPPDPVLQPPRRALRRSPRRPPHPRRLRHLHRHRLAHPLVRHRRRCSAPGLLPGHRGLRRRLRPEADAGTQNPLAGAYSPFHLRLTRADATQELAGLALKLPRGLLANLTGISYCPDSTLASISTALGTGGGEVASPSCPANSQLGTVTVGAGAGPNPFYSETGRVYWTGPYKGAPVSIAAVVPARRRPLRPRHRRRPQRPARRPRDRRDHRRLRPPAPILQGIPLDLRDVRVDLTRPNYTLNPTSCEPKTLDATLTSTTGATADRSNHFQAANCERLGFKPRLSFAFKGPVHRRAHPSLTATYRARPGDANLARAQVKLPPAAFLDNSHIGGVCTRVQFAAERSAPPTRSTATPRRPARSSPTRSPATSTCAPPATSSPTWSPTSAAPPASRSRSPSPAAPTRSRAPCATPSSSSPTPRSPNSSSPSSARNAA